MEDVNEIRSRLRLTRRMNNPSLSEGGVGRGRPAAATFSKAGYAYETLRQMIVDGTYRPGDRLRLAHIARNLNLSEMPVREALRLLQKDGLVVMHLHRGAEVASLSLEQALEVTEVRIQLECLAGEQSVANHDQISIAELRRILSEMKKAKKNATLFALKNREFITSFLSKCPNSFIKQHIQDLWDQAWRHSSPSIFGFMQHRISEALSENRDIIQCVEKKNAALCRKLLQKRSQSILNGWRRAIESAGSSGSR